jgi:serine/threonine protein kinase
VQTVLGERYVLGELIGRGGMADVYRATDRTLDRPVAVKVVRDLAEDEADRLRFVNEARTLASLSHSGLVTVLDAGLGQTETHPSPEHLYLVMELVDGPTAAQVLAQGPVPIEQVGAWGVQVAEALEFVHRHGIVHRDVKPANILLGSDGRVRLADFGISRLLDDAARNTRTGQTIGTAAYLSPEQVTGEAVSGASDVYSLGLVLLEAITGRQEYDGLPTQAALARVHRSPRVPDDLPGSWPQLLTAMTDSDPGRRPSAEEVAQTLHGEATSPIPVVEVRPADPAVAPILGRQAGPETSDGDHTRVLPGGGTATVRLPSAAGAGAGPAAASPPRTSTVRPFLDRAGDRVTHLVSRLVQRGRDLEPHQRGAVVAALGLLLFVVLIAVLAGDGSGSSDLPAETPAELRGPLQELHDAVEGD